MLLIADTGLSRKSLDRIFMVGPFTSVGHMRFRILPVLPIICVLLLTGGANAAPTPATAVVVGLHDHLLAVMKAADTLGFEGRRNELAPVIAATFDTPLIARASTGRHWKKFDPGQKEKLIDALARLTVATYAARFDDYAGENFRVLSEEPAPRETVLVNTELVKANGETVRLGYLLRLTGDGWRVIDVFLKGVYSELALKRSEYAAVIERGGFEGLIAAIDEKIAAFESESRN
jgi:phospholipid transport system substrate-binding protein